MSESILPLENALRIVRVLMEFCSLEEALQNPVIPVVHRERIRRMLQDEAEAVSRDS